MRGTEAKNNFKSGYNCAQSVVLAFSDMFDFDENMLLKMSSSFGGGFGRLREVCGAFSGAAMVLGYKLGYTETGDYEGKKKLYSIVQEAADEFKKVAGSIVCRELRGLNGAQSPAPEKRTEEYYHAVPCAELCELAAQITEKLIEKYAD